MHVSVATVGARSVSKMKLIVLDDVGRTDRINNSAFNSSHTFGIEHLRYIATDDTSPGFLEPFTRAGFDVYR